jgi:DNA-binding beta-propeller fold protein YncE
VFLFAALGSHAQTTNTNFFNTTNYFNFETAPVHPVALSPDATRLVVCNLPTGRLYIFDVTSGFPVKLGSIPVGIDPVTVRFRTATELWVANYISGSISIVDLPTMRVFNTITTTNQPSDIVFASAASRAYVSCGQPNLVQVFNTSNSQLVTNLLIDGNRPRAMDVSPDGSKVYVAIFESGNASTIIGSGVTSLTSLPRPSPIDLPATPDGGLNPPPNSGANFVPPINPLITNPPPPRVGLIVKRNASGRWMDDNNDDWTEFISGTNAAFTGRSPGWNMPDHDLAVINTTNFSIAYVTGLMNICMAVGVNPSSGEVYVVGTDALNNIRFQFDLESTFIRVNVAQVDPVALTSSIVDLNSHLNYQTNQVSVAQRNISIGDPRAIVWSPDGTQGYVTGMGSDNLIIINAQGNRAGLNPSINVGSGPTGMALDASRNRLYVYNRFDGSLSTVDTSAQAVTNTLSLFDPTPPVIKLGRPNLYNTHLFSGLGQLACASCHVDSRFDRLAWDLGDQTATIEVVGPSYNFLGNFPAPTPTNNFHPMKGPMTTQTLQDIIGHEPFHWRGDRAGIEAFDVTFTNLQGAVTGITTNQMQQFKSFLATVRHGPNPYRLLDNSLATNLPLPGQFALGRGQLPAGAPLPNGNAQNGQANFQNTTTSCSLCHTTPTGLGADMVFNNVQWVSIPAGSNSAHHIAITELPRASNLPFKVPQLRDMFDKFGMDLLHTNSRAGFGFLHDGSVDSLVRFVQDGFAFTDDQITADMVAFLLSFSGSDLLTNLVTDPNRPPGGLVSLDTDAGVGFQITINNSNSVPLLNTMIGLANSTTSRVDLIVKGWESGLARGWFLNRTNGLFQSDRLAETETPAALRALAAVGSEQTYTLVGRGTGERLGIDEDADGYFDRDELDYGSDPENPYSIPTNTPPVLSPISNLTVLKGTLVRVTCVATDTDIPAQILTFSLGTNAPPGATINPTNGVFTWLAAGPPGMSTNSITVIVTDNGKPNKSASQTFKVVVVDLSVTGLSVTTSGVTVSWTCLSNMTYQLQYKNHLNDPAWINIPGQVTPVGNSASKIDPAPATNTTRFYRILALP